MGWQTAASADDAVYPDGYVPAVPNPVDDFNSKFFGARLVHDIGTAQERMFVFGNEMLDTGFVGSDGLPFTGILSPVLRPLSVGRHTSTVFITMSASHRDGAGVDADLNCLPAGEIQRTGDTPFRFVQRRG